MRISFITWLGLFLLLIDSECKTNNFFFFNISLFLGSIEEGYKLS